MPLPPTDKTAAGDPVSRPARIIMDSPLAASTRVIARRRRTRVKPRERGLRVLAAIGALVVHLVFLFGFVLGPAYEVKQPPESKQQFLHVRLIEAPEPPPPPPVRGTPPRERGPRHQGHVASQRTPVSQRSSEASAPSVAQVTPAAATPVVAQAAKVEAPRPQPVAAPPPPVSLPKPAPTQQLQPIPLAGEPPVVTLPTPSLQPPVPPKFQPEPVRKPQVEGTQSLPSPASLAPTELPAPAMPKIAVPSIALNIAVPQSSAPASITPARAQLPAAPPVPALQAIPLPAQPSPSVNLKASVSVPMPTVPRELPKLQAPAVEPAEVQLEAVPLASKTAPPAELRAPTVKINVADKAFTPAVQPSIAPPQLSTPSVAASTAATAAQPTAANLSAPSSATAATEQPATSNPGQTDNEHDVSTAPNATPQGSDNAVPGEPNGLTAAPQTTEKQGEGPLPTHGQGSGKAVAGKAAGGAETGGSQAGDTQGTKPGEPGGYVQIAPHGDTQIMDHGTPNIGYQPTRFDKDWTPPGESSIDTALRHAVEKTTVAHTFHLPRGVRVECAIRPLLPIALFGCRNPDPPPAPVASKVYDRLHMAPANPLVPPAPASAAASIAATPIKLDNSAECAVARVAGGPPPPGCETITLPVKLGRPASSSSSWVPASDQFH